MGRLRGISAITILIYTLFVAIPVVFAGDKALVTEQEQKVKAKSSEFKKDEDAGPSTPSERDEAFKDLKKICDELDDSQLKANCLGAANRSV